MTPFSFNKPTWKDFFLKAASDKDYSGSSLSSIKLASTSLSTQDKIRLLESDKNLSMLTDDDGNSLLLFHKFQNMPSTIMKHENKLVALAGFDSFSTPVIINTPSIKNYSQVVPKWDILQNINSTSEFQNYCADVESTTISNAIIIPLPLLCVFLTTDDQTPANLAIQLIAEMKRLDSIHKTSAKNDHSPPKNLQDLENLSTSSSTESYLEHCGYIIQWLFLTLSNRIKPVRYSIARDTSIIQWFENCTLELSKDNFYQHLHDNSDGQPKKLPTPSFDPTTTISPYQNSSNLTTDRNIQQLTVSTLIEMKESLEAARIRAEKKDEKKERSFNKLPKHRKQMILNASATYPFTDPATSPTEFYASILTEKSAFKVKQLLDHELSTTPVKRFKVSPALAASIWIGDLISDDLTPSNLSIWFCPERSHNDTKESDLERGLWIMDGKHVRSDIQILSKTTIYVPDGVMDAYFMILNFKTISQLLLGKGSEIDIFLNEWLDHIFSNRELYIVQQDDDRTFLAQVLHCINQAIHLYLDSCGKHSRADVRDNFLNQEDKRDLIEQRNFIQKLPSAIKSIFNSTDKEDDKNIENGGKGKNGGKRKLDDDDRQLGKRIDNKIKELQKFRLKPKDSFQPYYDRSRECPKFKEGLPCMKFLLKGYCHTKCNRLHHLNNDQQKEFEKFLVNVRDNIKEQDFLQGAADAEH